MSQHVNVRRLLAAQITGALLASIFTLSTGGLLLLVVAVGGINKNERLGYACIAAAASLSLWVVVYLIHMARQESRPRRFR